MSQACVASIQAGMPLIRGADAYSDQDWESGIFKAPVTKPVWLSQSGLEGDGQADRKNHGGPDRTILLYAQRHYDYWRDDLPELNWVQGGFGENLTVTHLTEETVAIGDVYQIGDDVRIQISQPRRPCWKLARRWQQKDLTARAEATGYTGWYARILDEGMIEAGMPLTLLQRPFSQWTIRHVQAILHDPEQFHSEAEALSQCNAFSHDLRERLSERLKRKLT